MTADQYLQSILHRETVDTGPSSPVRSVQTTLTPVIQAWAGNRLAGLHPSGSFMKGTANRSGTDIDLFVSLSEATTEGLREIYEKLYERMQGAGYSPRRQNVSIGVTVGGHSVDLVPGKRQDASSGDHSLYRRRADTWTKTNVITHINHVINSGRQDETRILKLWRDQRALDFPSFYLELAVIAALSPRAPGTLSDNVWRVLGYFADGFSGARFVDPANTNNIVSDDLAATGKAKVRMAASEALTAKDWNQVVV